MFSIHSGIPTAAQTPFFAGGTSFLLKKGFLMFIYFWDNARDGVRAAEGQTQGDTESETGSRLWAVSPEPDAGFELTNLEIMTWDQVGCSTDWATQAPLKNFFKKVRETPTKNPLELINSVKLQDRKINVKTSVTFLYTNSEATEKLSKQSHS